MGSPPWRYRPTVDPLTVMMSSLPSLSQSIRPTPPLMDSTMYFLSGEEMCGTVSPAFWAKSSNCGTGDCGAGGLEEGIWASEIAANNKPIQKARPGRIGGKRLDYN